MQKNLTAMTVHVLDAVGAMEMEYAREQQIVVVVARQIAKIV